MRKYAVWTIASIFMLAGYVGVVQAAPPCSVGKGIPTYAPPGEVIGMPVIDVHGKPLGHLENVIFDWSSSRIGYGVVSYEGNSYYVPWSTMACNTDGTSLRLQVDQQTVLSSPPVKEGTRMSKATRLKVQQYYGLAPYWEDTVQERPRVPSPSVIQPTFPSVPGEGINR